jgi:hypothetical protein
VPTPTSGVPSPDGIPCRDCGVPFAFDRLGVRVPFIAVSPWIPAQVFHGPLPFAAGNAYTPSNTSQMEHSSMVATLRAFFNVSTPLNARDAWAARLDWLWTTNNLTAPRTDCPMTLPEPPVGSPSFIGRPRGGNNPLSHLHRDLLYLVEGAVGGATTAEHVHERQAALGLNTEAAVGRHARDLMAAALTRARAAVAATTDAASAAPVAAAAAATV